MPGGSRLIHAIYFVASVEGSLLTMKMRSARNENITNLLLYVMASDRRFRGRYVDIHVITLAETYRPVPP